MFGGVVFFAFVFIFLILLYVKNHSKSTFSCDRVRRVKERAYYQLQQQ
jgi:hypothetical protein